MNEILEKIGELGLVPVIKIERAGDAVKLGRALVEGELPVAEVTFRTDAAVEAIGTLTRELPELLVGAGTVLSVDQAERAAAAGARFIVSPGFNPKVVDWCLDHDIPVTPGINSPSQLEMALERELPAVKFFPAEASGGLQMIKAMAAPYGGVKFIPTGGINQSNLQSYLSYDRILACGGSWMVKGDLISAGKFKEITGLVRSAVAAVHGFEIARVGLPTGSAEKAAETAQLLSWLFFWPVGEIGGAPLAGSGVELLGDGSADSRGAIFIATNNLRRASAYLKRKGIEAVSDSPAGQDSRETEIVLNLEIHGYTVHLLQK